MKPRTPEALRDHLLHRAIESFRAARRFAGRVERLHAEAPDNPAAGPLLELARWQLNQTSEWLVEVLHARHGSEAECGVRYGRETFLAVAGGSSTSDWSLAVVPVARIADVDPR